eukprot:scaffold442_cov397-Prasinococcus_capsulatus_cf.AAC.15
MNKHQRATPERVTHIVLPTMPEEYSPHLKQPTSSLAMIDSHTAHISNDSHVSTFESNKDGVFPSTSMGAALGSL